MEKLLEKYLGEPLEKVKKELEEQGFKVLVNENSLMKIQTDYKLVVSIKKQDNKVVELIVGDFLINIENKID